MEGQKGLGVELEPVGISLLVLFLAFVSRYWAMLIGVPALRWLSRRPKVARRLFPMASEEIISEKLSKGAKETLSWSEGVGSSLGAVIIWVIIFVYNIFIETIIPWAAVGVMFLMLLVPNVAIMFIGQKLAGKPSSPKAPPPGR